MEGCQPRSPQSFTLVNYPASYHNGSGSLSFGDGHSEIHRWQDPRTRPALQRGGTLPVPEKSPSNRDVEWLQERSSAKR
jgi:prepilin-type processing-associated H-X9-DG protein